MGVVVVVFQQVSGDDDVLLWARGNLMEATG